MTSAATVAFADDEPATTTLSPALGKNDVVAIVVGKKVDDLRKRDGARQAYDFKDDGKVYFTTSTTTRNTSFSGTYALGDDGTLCFKWNPDKNISLPDGCILFKRDGDKLVMVGERHPDVVFAEVIR